LGTYQQASSVVSHRIHDPLLVTDFSTIVCLSCFNHSLPQDETVLKWSAPTQWSVKYTQSLQLMWQIFQNNVLWHVAKRIAAQSAWSQQMKEVIH
jgi:hypothetical protein